MKSYIVAGLAGYIGALILGYFVGVYVSLEPAVVEWSMVSRGAHVWFSLFGAAVGMFMNAYRRGE